ncbi:MAG: ABC transporter permease [Thaumarchaeota archaeon]|nr:ABC transporter permease [Candidatus Geocrenenecus arthurdayi]MCL7389335.1 ABC transporter permease [Candidatus Geocrenenecus arthurdayi]MCL7390536.1 ABC transporter permease [Candidatus Geocrenenecus arthurdayi]MCL7396528.1 ABC transporter permease [Candidatus Geocrenenecus arthurdayi]MCL7401634.1 ABC transporter permease [Candidatus Geocrenenecus arthurdayi]
MSIQWVEQVLQLTVQMGTVYLLASLGEIYAERSGVLNLGLEGMMIMGAATSFIFSIAYGHLPAIFIAAVVGALMGFILSILAVDMKLNQVIVGLALTLLGIGLSGFFTFPEIRKNILLKLNPSLPEEMLLTQQAEKLPEIPIPLFSNIPILGKMLFSHNVLVYFSLIFSILMWFILFKTRIGLTIRSVGENPSMADSLGVNVYMVRRATTIISGAFASLAGAYFFIGFHPFWREGVTAGRGFIALALVILATWSPLRAILGAYLFGGVETFQYRLQLFGLGAQSPYFLAMLPYIMTIITLIIISTESIKKKIGAPASLGIPYSREE